MFDVLGIGTIVIDYQIVLDSYPAENSKSAIQVARRQIGGPVPTALVLLSRFGLDCSFVGAWGHDDAGALIDQDLAAERIDVTYAVKDAQGGTGFAHVWIARDSASRTIVNHRGCGADERLFCFEDGLPAPCRVLQLDGILPDIAAAAARAARGRGTLVCLDAGSPKPGLHRIIPHVDIMVCPEHFVKEYYDVEHDEDGARLLLDEGVGTVVITRGDQGAELFRPDDRHAEPAHVVEAVDTTGAGDVFCGALAYAVLQGWAWPKCLRFANVAAALKCAGLGNREALPGIARVTDVAWG